MDSLRYQKFRDLNYSDIFFDSLRADYKEFPSWLEKKSKNDESAFVLYDDAGKIEGFMYLKGNDDASDIIPPLPDGNHLKIGTFKFHSKQTLRGQRFLKKAFDSAIALNSDDIYVTVFSKHDGLVRLLQSYGFYKHGEKETDNGTECVYVKTLNEIHGDVLLDYPFIVGNTSRKYLLAIYPEFHTKLFPDSKLITESPDIVKDLSHTNSIHKVYLCNMKQSLSLKRGDILVIYRTKPKDDPGKAYYRSVATSFCVVESVRHISEFSNEEHFVNYCQKFSVFNTQELISSYRTLKHPYIIRFTYNLALPKRLTRASLIEDVGLDGSPTNRWGLFEISNEQFNKIVELGEVNESFIINKT